MLLLQQAKILERVSLKMMMLPAIIGLTTVLFVFLRPKDEDVKDTADGTSAKVAAVSARAAWHAPRGQKFLSPSGSDVVLKDVQRDIFDKVYKYTDHAAHHARRHAENYVNGYGREQWRADADYRANRVRAHQGGNIRLGNSNNTNYNKWLNKRDDDHWVRLSDHEGSTRLGGTLAALDMYTNGTLEVDGRFKVGDRVYSNDELRRALDNALNSVQKGTEYELDGNTHPGSCLASDNLDLRLRHDGWDQAQWMDKGRYNGKNGKTCMKIKMN